MIAAQADQHTKTNLYVQNVVNTRQYSESTCELARVNNYIFTKSTPYKFNDVLSLILLLLNFQESQNDHDRHINLLALLFSSAKVY